MIDAGDLVDLENGTQSRLLFWDEQVYRQEVERIFNRSGLFLAHDSVIPKPGKFVPAKMIEDDIIVARHGSVPAFLNSCTHRDNNMCHADSGMPATGGLLFRASYSASVSDPRRLETAVKK